MHFGSFHSFYLMVTTVGLFKHFSEKQTRALCAVKESASIFFLFTRWPNPSHTILKKLHILSSYNGVERLHKSSFK